MHQVGIQEKKLGWITRKRFEPIARAKKTEALYIVIGNLHWKTFISYQYVIIIITNIRRVEQAIHILYRHPYNVVLFAKWIKKITQVELAVLNKWYCRICAKKFHLLFSYLYLLEHWITNRTPFWSYTKTLQFNSLNQNEKCLESEWKLKGDRKNDKSEWGLPPPPLYMYIYIHWNTKSLVQLIRKQF